MTTINRVHVFSLSDTPEDNLFSRVTQSGFETNLDGHIYYAATVEYANAKKMYDITLKWIADKHSDAETLHSTISQICQNVVLCENKDGFSPETFTEQLLDDLAEYGPFESSMLVSKKISLQLSANRICKCLIL